MLLEACHSSNEESRRLEDWRYQKWSSGCKKISTPRTWSLEDWNTDTLRRRPEREKLGTSRRKSPEDWKIGTSKNGVLGARRSTLLERVCCLDDWNTGIRMLEARHSPKDESRRLKDRDSHKRSPGARSSTLPERGVLMIVKPLLLEVEYRMREAQHSSMESQRLEDRYSQKRSLECWMLSTIEHTQRFEYWHTQKQSHEC
jgi:hypothetical protein